MGYEGIQKHVSELQKAMLDATPDNVLYSPWSQYIQGAKIEYRAWLGYGVCQGLSIKFLQAERRNVLMTDVLLNLTLEGFPGEGVLNKELADSSSPGNKDSQSDQDLHAFMSQHYMFKHAATENFGDFSSLLSHTRFAHYIAGCPGYYLINNVTSSKRGHVMACASKDGRLRFFDPNAGIVSCKGKDQLTSFCTAYFGSRAAQEVYRKEGGKVVLKVHKYLE